MKKKSNHLENNPHYIDGVRKAHVIIRFIDVNMYKTLENALEAKQDLNAMLASELGYDESNTEYVVNLGIIDTLQEAINQKQ